MASEKKSDTKYYWIFGLVVSLALVLGVYVGLEVVKPRQAQVELPENPKGQQVGLSMGEADVLVEVRDDDVGRTLGLSGRESLGANEGMLFVFDTLQQPVFWMKDMVIDLDVVWIRDGVVVAVEENVLAPSEAEPVVRTMTPGTEVDMVLEVPAGWVVENGVQVGDEVKLGSW